MVKNPSANAGDSGDKGLIPGSERSPGGENGNPPQHSVKDREAWQATVNGAAKSWTRLSDCACMHNPLGEFLN